MSKKRSANDSSGSGCGQVRGCYGRDGTLSASIACWKFLTGFSRTEGRDLDKICTPNWFYGAVSRERHGSWKFPQNYCFCGLIFF